MRSATPYPTSLMLLLTLCIIAAGCGPLGAGEAVCGVDSPTLKAEPSRTVADRAFNLQGRVFFSDFGCDDVGPEWWPGETSGLRPDDSIRIEFVQGEKTWDLANVGSDENLAFETILDVPSLDYRVPGHAVIKATSSTVGTVNGMRTPVTTSFVVLDAPQEAAR